MSTLEVKPRNRFAAKFSSPLKSVDWSDLDVSVTKSKFNRTTNLLISALVLISSACVLFGYIAVQISRKYRSAIDYSSDLKILKHENNFFNQIGGVIIVLMLLVFVLLIIWTRRLYESTSRLWLGSSDWNKRRANWVWLSPLAVVLIPIVVSPIVVIANFSDDLFRPLLALMIFALSLFLTIDLLFRPARLLLEIDRMLKGNILIFRQDGPRLADGWKRERASKIVVSWFALFSIGLPLLAIGGPLMRNPLSFDSLEEGANSYEKFSKLVFVGGLCAAAAGFIAIYFIHVTRKNLNESVYANLNTLPIAQRVTWKSPLEDQHTNRELTANFGSEAKEKIVAARDKFFHTWKLKLERLREESSKFFHTWKLKLERLREESRSKARARQSAKEAREEAAELARLIRLREEQKIAKRLNAEKWEDEKRRTADYEKAKELAMLPLEVGGPARIPKDADDFEEVCAEFSRLIFRDAKRTPKGPDGGVDVLGKDMVGQAKFHPSKKVVGHDVVALAGSRQRNKKKFGLFFHYGPGYSPDAIAAARDTDVILFSLDVDKRRFVRVR
jgi:hypothetical protein